MRISELTAFVVAVPLKHEVKHASATRHQSENLMIRCRLGDGSTGWGEGVPRHYVTGETTDGAIAQLKATPLGEQLNGDCQTWDDVIELCDRFQLTQTHDDPRGCYGNALRCAVELSILDAFGRLFGQPLSTVTHRFAPAASIGTTVKSVRYSSAITSAGPKSERLSAIKMRLYGFAQCKVKVGVKGADDEERLRRIRRWIGPRVDLRLDANEAWQCSQIAAKIEPLLAYNVSCVEQPVPHDQVAQLADARRQFSIPVMLDESLTSVSDARQAIRLGTCDLFNIRLSKCGGFLQSLKLAAIAHEAGLGYQLGCHPGESGVLSAAGRHWSSTVRNIRYLEGSYDRHLLKQQLTYEDITFGYGGRAPALPGPGLGVTVNPTVLNQLTKRKESYNLDQ